jgi:hypothetical protein
MRTYGQAFGFATGYWKAEIHMRVGGKRNPICEQSHGADSNRAAQRHTGTWDVHSRSCDVRKETLEAHFMKRAALTLQVSRSACDPGDIESCRTFGRVWVTGEPTVPFHRTCCIEPMFLLEYRSTYMCTCRCNRVGSSEFGRVKIKLFLTRPEAKRT